MEHPSRGSHLLFIFTIFLSIQEQFVVEGGAFGTIKWIPWDEFFPTEEVPVGLEDGKHKMFTMRAVLEGGVTQCGRYSPDHMVAWIPVSTLEKKTDMEDAEYLSYPKGTISWVFTKGNRLPANVLQGGPNYKDQIVYPCRAMHEGHLLPGKYLHVVGKCIMPFHGKEHFNDEFEMPVVNYLAKALGAEPITETKETPTPPASAPKPQMAEAAD